MLGKNESFLSIPYFWTVQFGKSVRYCGHALSWDEIVYQGSPEERKFVAYYIKCVINKSFCVYVIVCDMIQTVMCSFKPIHCFYPLTALLLCGRPYIAFIHPVHCLYVVGHTLPLSTLCIVFMW